MNKVMVFGTFDGIHDGHRSLFEQAKSHGEHLVVVVAPDDVVHRLKGCLPEHHEGDRMERVGRENHVDSVVMGDAELGLWQVVHRHRPSVIALGYDQEEMRRDLENHAGSFTWPVEVKMMRPYKPETHHNRIIKKTKRE